ncbi:MAG: terpene cyclase/mutase family protein [Kiritimatiellaeota bacterium]|nr:terpene cyclase/mutase family protein [Kiritimatiellota bacterium]
MSDTGRHDRAYREMLKLFEEASFAQRMRRMLSGLGQPKESGEYKFARLQMQRLLAPFLAVTVPLALLVTLLAVGPTMEAGDRAFNVEVIPEQEIEPLEEPDFVPPEISEEVFESDYAYDDFTDVVADADAAPSPTMSEASAVLQIKSPIVMLGMQTGAPTRASPKARRDSMRDTGGTSATEDAVMHALRWYVTKQNPDGSWGKGGYRTAMTGFALLCFLAHGETPNESEEFGGTVQRGILYLLNDIQPDGMFSVTRTGSNFSYSQGIAAYALCEAFAMTRNPAIGEAAERTLVPIIQGQHPNGGWDYGLAQTDRDDTSFMGWCAQAIKAGHAARLDVPGLQETYDMITPGMKVNFGSTADKKMGGFGYTEPVTSGGLTAVGVLCLQLTGHAKDAAARAGLNTLDTWTVGWNDGYFGTDDGAGQYYFYYATQCMFHEGGNRWLQWNSRMKPAYTKAQTVIPATRSGYTDHTGTPQAIGFWDYEPSHDVPEHDGIFGTALVTLQMEVYYRYLPTYQALAVLDDSTVLDDAPDGGFIIDLKF